MNKYGNKKKTIDGHIFDSTKEANRYIELTWMLRGGIITDLELQPEFELQPKFKKNGKNYRNIVYKADFKYYDNQRKKIVVEDVKGFETDVFKLKRKMFEYHYPDYELTLI